MKSRGQIVRMMEGKNFGFIRINNKAEYFFHRDDYNGNWHQLQEHFTQNKRVEVECDIVPDAPKGPRVSNVSLV